MLKNMLHGSRCRQLAIAISAGDLERISQLMRHRIDLVRFSVQKSNPIPHAPEHTTTLTDVLELAATSHLATEGFQMLIEGGAPLSERAYAIAHNYAGAGGAGPWPDAAQVAPLISPEAFAARAQSQSLQGSAAPARGTSRIRQL